MTFSFGPRKFQHPLIYIYIYIYIYKRVLKFYTWYTWGEMKDVNLNDEKTSVLHHKYSFFNKISFLVNILNSLVTNYIKNYTVKISDQNSINKYVSVFSLIYPHFYIYAYTYISKNQQTNCYRQFYTCAGIRKWVFIQLSMRPKCHTR